MVVNIESVKSLVKAIDHAESDAEALEVATNFAHAVYLLGMRQSTTDYAVWRDGEQLVGTMQRPLADVLEKQLHGQFVMDEHGCSVIY